MYTKRRKFKTANILYILGIIFHIIQMENSLILVKVHTLQIEKDE